jgi:biotin carboxyl carrier protein
VVEFEGEERVRAGMKALVTEVRVKDGDRVAAGDTIVRLSNPDEEAIRDQLVLELAMARIRARNYYQTGELAAHQGELELIGGLEKKLAESNRYLASATVTAPIAGEVIGRNLDSLEGNWVEVGEEIVTIAGGTEKELLLSIRQEDIETVAGLLGKEIRVRLRGRSEETAGTLERIESRATTSVPHPALVANHGGPLAIQAMADQPDLRENELASAKGARPGGGGGGSGGLEAAESPYELAQPRFLARARLRDPDEATDWLVGEWGFVRFGEAERTRLGRWLYEGVVRYVRQSLDQARKSAESGDQ